MHPIVEIQETADGDVGFTVAEQKRIKDFKIPGDYSRSNYGRQMFPRRPARNVKEWLDNHSAKLASLIRASK